LNDIVKSPTLGVIFAVVSEFLLLLSHVLPSGLQYFDAVGPVTWR